MVDSKRYSPTNKRFQKHTQAFVSGKTKKGHLTNEEREAGDVVKETGILVKVNKNKIYEKGWEVKIDDKTYMCTYGDNIVYLPPCTLNGSYYMPKKECKVEVSIDKKSQIYTITRIDDADKQPIAMVNNSITLQTSGEASLTISDDTTTISGTELSVEGDIKVDTSKDDTVSTDTISITNLYKRIQILESKLSDKDDSGEQ